MQSTCSICKQRSIYTCPRCSTRTCSARCSAAHKSRTKCTGERDKTKYVPMNEYGWGTMMNDYVFLEDAGRKVEEWGRGVTRGDVEAFGRRGSETDKRKGKGRDTNTKRDTLKMQLGLRDIEMDLLPIGMNRRKLNQSYWDSKNKTAYLTIEFKFHHPPHLLPSSHPPPTSFALLTHRNGFDASLLSLMRSHIAKSQKDVTVPCWVTTLVCQDANDPDSFSPPDCVMTAPIDPLWGLTQGGRARYYKLDSSQELSVLLRHKEFVEYPTIEVWEEFRGTIVDTHGTIIRYAEAERPLKRQRFDVNAGKRAIRGLLGEYGSDKEEEEDRENVLSMIGEYEGSDEDEVVEPSMDLDESSEEETYDNLEPEPDPSALYNLVQRLREEKQWIGGQDDNVRVELGGT